VEGNGGTSARRRRLDPYLAALIVLVLIMCTIYTYTFYGHDFPLRGSGSDTYAHLGLLRSTRDQLGMDEALTPDMFPYIYRQNNRSGVNYVSMALISGLPGISNIDVLYLFGLLGIVFFLTGIYRLTWALSRSKMSALLAALFSLVLCSFDTGVSGNSFTLVEILVDAHYASILALGLSLHLIAFNLRYLERGTRKLYFLQVLLGFLVFNIHMLTGIMYFLILCLLVAVYALKDRRLSREHLALLSIIPAVLAVASLWPLYRWWSIFQKGAVKFGESQPGRYSFAMFINTMLLYSIGLPFLISAKRERLFLLAWTVVFAAVALSVLTPLRIAYAWRFDNIMIVPLIIGLALGLGSDIWRLARWRVVAIPVILIIASCFLGTAIYRTVLRYEGVMERNAYAEIAAFAPFSRKGDNLIAHPTPSYDLMGVSDFNVVTVTEGHASREITAERNRMLREAFLAPDLDTWRSLLGRFGAERVLVPRSGRYTGTLLLLNGVRLARNLRFELYEAGPGRLDSIVLDKTPDPDLQEWSEPNGFLRYERWNDIQLAGIGDMVLRPVSDPETPGDFYLRVETAERPGSQALVNRGFIAVDAAIPYRIKVTLRNVEGDAEVYLALIQYSEPGQDSLLGWTNSRTYFPLEGWQEAQAVVTPNPEGVAPFKFDPDTRYVKIGVIVRNNSASVVEVDRIQIFSI
jgi:hypothetical protein